LVIERFQIEAFGELIVGVALMIYTIPLLNITLTFGTIGLGLLFIILGALIYTSIKLITASIGFWVINSMPIMTTVYNIADFSKYPTTIFPKVIQYTVTYLIPFAFVSFLPATALLNRSNGLEILLGSIIAVSVLSIAAYRLWVLGLKSYQSVGS
jgi:ABC-2 type transport system permease protein